MMRGGNIKCPKSNEKREIERKNRCVTGEGESRQCFLKEIAVNCQLLTAFKSEDFIMALEVLS